MPESFAAQVPTIIMLYRLHCLILPLFTNSNCIQSVQVELGHISSEDRLNKADLLSCRSVFLFRALAFVTSLKLNNLVTNIVIFSLGRISLPV